MVHKQLLGMSYKRCQVLVVFPEICSCDHSWRTRQLGDAAAADYRPVVDQWSSSQRCRATRSPVDPDYRVQQGFPVHAPLAPAQVRDTQLDQLKSLTG